MLLLDGFMYFEHQLSFVFLLYYLVAFHITTIFILLIRERLYY